MEPALGFGIAGLFNEPGKVARQRMVRSVMDMGIRHFDMAPIYGLGLAEEEFGQAIKGHRDQVFIATKVGIAPTTLARALGRVQGPVRRILRASPALRQSARANAAGPSNGALGNYLYVKTYRPAEAMRSIESSLRALGTEYIDLLLIHDPHTSDIQSDDLYALLEGARGKGSIRQWGVAGEVAPTRAVVEAFAGPTPVVQIRDDIFHRPGSGWHPPSASFRVTFGILGEALPRILAHVTATPDRARRWGDATGGDCTSSEVVASFLLRDAFAANRDGVVLYSTSRPDRVGRARELFNERATTDEPDVEAFRKLVSDELGTVPLGTSDQA
jgi:D-threo-aldose 1-dehydrogenase